MSVRFHAKKSPGADARFHSHASLSFPLLALTSVVSLIGCSNTTERIESRSAIQQAIQQEYQADTVRVQVPSGDTTRVEITLIGPADTAATGCTAANSLFQIAREHYATPDSLDEIRIVFESPSEGGTGDLSRPRRYTFAMDGVHLCNVQFGVSRTEDVGVRRANIRE